MLNYIEIKAKINKWWDDGSFLQASLRGQVYFKREVPKIGLDDVKNIHEQVDAVFKSQDELVKNSKEVKGYGYSIEWQEKNFRNIGSNRFIKRITVDSEIDFLKLIGKEKEFDLFNKKTTYILGVLPELESWIIENPLSVIANSEKWTDLLKVLKYFKNEHIANKYYIRELPVSVDTKFIEKNSTLIRSLLDFLIPNKIITSKNFNERYSIKDKEKLIRVRILCDKLSKVYIYNDFSIKLSDFVLREINSLDIIITENELNFLTLPKRENTIAIWSGGGFQISYIANIEWLKRKRLFYWGDIDAAGLSILSQLRTYYPSAQSVLMDGDVFEKYYDNGKTDKTISAKNLRGLTTEEIKFYNYLNDNKLRLEQEKIPQKEIITLLNEI